MLASTDEVKVNENSFSKITKSSMKKKSKEI